MDPDQSDLSLHYLIKRLQKYLDRQQKQTAFVVIGILKLCQATEKVLGQLCIWHLIGFNAFGHKF